MINFSKRILPASSCVKTFRQFQTNRSTENTSFAPGFALLALMSGGVYAYYDPSVLPVALRSRQDNRKKVMTPEEYDAWRSKQDGVCSATQKTSNVIIEEPDSKSRDSVQSPSEIIASLTVLLQEMIAQRKEFMVELKREKLEEGRRRNNSDEDAAIKNFDSEIERLRNQIKFMKKM